MPIISTLALKGSYEPPYIITDPANIEDPISIAATLSNLLELQIAALKSATATLEAPISIPLFSEVSHQKAARANPKTGNIIASLNMHSKHFKSLLDSVVAAQRALHDRSAEIHNSLYAPVSLLPFETLHLIFTFVIVDVDSGSRFASGAKAPLAVSHVCRQWRLAALSQRTLWAGIDDGMCPELLEYFLDLSRGRHLSLTMQLDPALPTLSNPTPFHPTPAPTLLQLARINKKEESANILLQEVSNTRSLHLKLYKPDIIQPARRDGFTIPISFGPLNIPATPQQRPVIPRLSPVILLRQTFPNLEDLKLEYPGRNGEGVFLRTEITSERYPNLRSLTLRNFILESPRLTGPTVAAGGAGAPGGPYDYLPSMLPNLKFLVLDGLPMYINPAKVLNMLAGCQGLEVIHFNRLRWTRGPMSTPLSLIEAQVERAPVVLPNVREMTFVKTLPVKELVEGLRLPALTTLGLCYSNTIWGAAEDVLVSFHCSFF